MRILCTFIVLFIYAKTSLLAQNFTPDKEKILALLPKMVKIPHQSYELAEIEVTQALWLAVMGDNHSFFKDDDRRPVEMVSYYDITEQFLPKLNALVGGNYRLPTYQEWECAVKESINERNISHIAWFSENASEITHPVKTKIPNHLGIYDLVGNVQEWTMTTLNKTEYAVVGGSIIDKYEVYKPFKKKGKTNGRNHITGFRLCKDAH